MISPWHNPLPLEEYTTDPVVVYFYNGRWVPITHYSLKQAIALYQKAKEQGYRLFIFPSHVHPIEFEAPKQLGEERAYFQERRLSQEHSIKGA